MPLVKFKRTEPHNTNIKKTQLDIKKNAVILPLLAWEKSEKPIA